MLLPKHLRIVASEWQKHSTELAFWAMDRLVNRTDVWGQYTTISELEKQRTGKTYKFVTLPRRELRGTGRDMVTIEKLVRHFKGVKRSDLISLHLASGKNTSLWGAIDIDLHEKDRSGHDKAVRNEVAAIRWWEKLLDAGYDALLLDSNGQGGYHLVVLFEVAAPTADVYHFLQSVIDDWEMLDLDERPETYPRNVGGEGLGASLRLPGLHHSHDHITRVWSGDEGLPWLEGVGAIEAIMKSVPGPPPPKSDGRAQPPTAGKRRSKPKPSYRAPEGRKTVCIDLDATLLWHDRWRGAESFGEPVEGAAEFTRSLSKYARIIILSARLGGGGRGLHGKLEAWLQQNGITFDELTSVKPPAHAYVDDRAVVCRPQEMGPLAFLLAEAHCRQLCGLDEGDAKRAEMLELWGYWQLISSKDRLRLLDQIKNIATHT